MNRRTLLRLATLLPVGFASPFDKAWAQSWPQRTVKLIVTLGPGSATDIAARLVADRLLASRSAVALARMGPPRSACRVNWPGGAGCLAVASLNSAAEQVALSLSATHQPTICG